MTENVRGYRKLSKEEQKERAPKFYWASQALFVVFMLILTPFILAAVFYDGLGFLLIVGTPLFIWVVVSHGVGRDALAREGLDGRVWMWVVFLIGPIGLLAYLVVRDGHEKVSDNRFDRDSVGITSSTNSVTESRVDRVCPDCGRVLESNDRFCSSCGKDVSAGVEAPERPNA